MPRRKKVNICDDHEIVKEKALEAQELVEWLEVGSSISAKKRNKLLKLLKAILKHNEYATDSGQNMEDRLREYRDAVERLGFKRV